MEEKITPEEAELHKQTVALEQAGVEQLAQQLKLGADELYRQSLDVAQATIDSVKQELAMIPQMIEDDLDMFNNTLKWLMNYNVDPQVDVFSSEFDIDVALAEFKKLLDPLIGSISPIESIVGKVPLIGDILGLLLKLTANTDNGGLTKDEIKKLLPNKPEVPTTLVNKVQETYQTVQQFCSRLPMLLIDVIFQMLGSIFDMFDQIAGVIGVPSFPFPFNLVKSMPKMIPKVGNFVTSAPSQVKNIVMGILKEKFAAAMALSIPKPPEPSQLASAAKAAAEQAASTAAGLCAPQQVVKPPVPQTVVPSPPTQDIPPSAPNDLTMDQVKEKWAKRFADDYNYDGDEIKKVIDARNAVFNGATDDITAVAYSLTDPIRTLKRRKEEPEEVNNWMLQQYIFQKQLQNIGYLVLMKANEAIGLFSEVNQKLQVDTLRNLGDKEVVVMKYLNPKKSFLSWCGF